MKRYDSYKDSGVQWIGEIPSHWEVCKCSLPIPDIGSGTTPTSTKKEYYTDDGNGYNWLQTGDLNDGVICSTSKHVTELAVRECNLRFYPKNSVIIAMYGATIGKVGYLSIETSTNQACCVLPPNNGIESKYIQYVFLSAKPQLLVDAIGGGQPNISQDVIKNTRIPVPNISEQTAIATYLDNKCSKIDNVITTQEKRVELLRELKQSIITRAVTRGINPDAKMKDSGVEWIGEIPDHWEVTPLKHIIKFVNGFAFNSNDFDSDGDMPVYRIGDIANDKVSTDSCVYVEKQESLQSFEVKEGDILLAMSGATTGKIGLVSDQKGYINQRVGIIRSNIQKWVFLSLKTSLFAEYIYLSAIGSAQPNISTENFGNYVIALPPKEEIKSIVENIIKQITRLDSSITKALRQIELLKEYKQSLITEVVTGKRKVV